LGVGVVVDAISILETPIPSLSTPSALLPRRIKPKRKLMSVTLAQASTIVDVALKKGRDTNCAPLTVAVLDAGGHLVAFKREDRAGIMRVDIAFGKPWGALGCGFASRTLGERAEKQPVFF